MADWTIGRPLIWRSVNLHIFYSECILTRSNKGGIFEAGFGEILLSLLLTVSRKRKFQPDSRKPGLTDPSLKDNATFEAKKCQP